MINIDLEKVRQLMSEPESIRNVVIVSQCDYGKTTLSNQLVEEAGIIFNQKANEKNVSERFQPECRSQKYQLYYENDDKRTQPNKFLINIIDSIGHIEFIQDVITSLRISDGTLIVVDYIEGMGGQTESILRLALQEKVKPILIINKVDKAILELKQDGETIYQNYLGLVEKINIIINTCYQNDMGEIILRPQDGEVCFGSGKYGWAFSCATFAKFYAKKFTVEETKLQQKLWGENYFDSEAKCWRNSNTATSGKVLKRAFVQFIMDPICKLTRVIIEGNLEQAQKMCDTLGLKLIDEEHQQYGENLLKIIMSKWLNATNTILQMMVNKLPSPKTAQKYRVDYLYSGQHDPIAESFKNCNPKGPLIMYVSKIVPFQDKFYAFGRIFSGTITQGQNIRIMGMDYQPGKKQDLYQTIVEGIVIIQGQKIEQIYDAPCGNMIGLLGIDKYLLKHGTISDHVDCHIIRQIKNLTIPIFKFAIQPKNPNDLPKLMQGLKRLTQIDSLVKVIHEETGELIIQGSGELHLEVCIRELQHDLNGIEIIVSEPMVVYKETISSNSNIICLAKSPNKHNRLYGEAQPLNEELSLAIEKQIIKPNDNVKERGKILADQYGWDQFEAQKIWAFGPENNGPNLFVDKTVGVHYLNEIQDMVASAFQWATKEGPLCEENLRGVRINLLDFYMNSDGIHRGGAQIIPSARRLVYSSCLTAQPRLLEPIQLTQITSPYSEIHNVYNCLQMRRGVLISEEQMIGTQLSVVQAYLPAVETFGFIKHLRHMTNGQAYSQTQFDHWANINGNPLESGTKAQETMLQIRRRKGLQDEVPDLNKYLDKI